MKRPRAQRGRLIKKLTSLGEHAHTLFFALFSSPILASGAGPRDWQSRTRINRTRFNWPATANLSPRLRTARRRQLDALASKRRPRLPMHLKARPRGCDFAILQIVPCQFTANRNGGSGRGRAHSVATARFPHTLAALDSLVAPMPQQRPPARHSAKGAPPARQVRALVREGALPAARRRRPTVTGAWRARRGPASSRRATQLKGDSGVPSQRVAAAPTCRGARSPPPNPLGSDRAD